MKTLEEEAEWYEFMDGITSFKAGYEWGKDNGINLEIDALKRQIEELRYNEDKLYSENDVLKLLIQFTHDGNDCRKLKGKEFEWFQEYKKQ